MTRLEQTLLAARLIGMSTALLLGPGLMLLAALRVKTEWPERITLALALSYCWIFALSILVPLLGLTADGAALLTAMLLVALGIAAARRHPRIRVARPGPSDIVLIAVAVIAAAAAWVIESPFTGEEVLDLTSISRFADGGTISPTNTSLLPDARPVYLFQPYQLALGVMARWSAIDPLIAFIKFRIFLVPLSLIVLFSLIRRLTPARADALPVFAIVLLFVALDFRTWEMNSLFPLVRRGGVGAGICVPVMLVLALVATRQTDDAAGRVLGRIALVTAPFMLVAALATHPLEMFTTLCFIGAMSVVVAAGLDRQANRRRMLLLLTLLISAVGTYITVQSRLVPYVAEYEREEKQVRRDDLARMIRNPIAAIAGRPSAGADLLTRTIPATSATVFGMTALPMAAVMAPASAAMLAVGIVPLALIYASPAGFIVVTLLTSVETVRDVNAYFALLGVISLGLALTATAHLVLNAARSGRPSIKRLLARALAISLAAWVILLIGRPLIQAFAETATLNPLAVLAIGTMAAVAVLVVSWRRDTARLRRSSLPTGVAVLALCLAFPLALPDAGIGGVFVEREPVDLVTRFRAAQATPSVVEWDRYYERLRETIAPPLPVPREVVDELRRRIPPRQVVLADPRYSCALVVLFNAYCINPASIYGHYFQPAIMYFRGYVSDRDSDVPQHPFFNLIPVVSQAERRLIHDYGVTYVLTDPRYGDLIGAKLAQIVENVQLEMTLDGYQLYRVTASSAKTPGR
jgi:hypothetical protein